MKTQSVFLSLLCLLNCSCNIQGNSWSIDSAFHPGISASNSIKMRSLTIDHTKVANTDQNNFQVLVYITDSTLRTVTNGGHVQNVKGYDTMFYSDKMATTPLIWEMESFDGITG